MASRGRVYEKTLIQPRTPKSPATRPTATWRSEPENIGRSAKPLSSLMSFRNHAARILLLDPSGARRLLQQVGDSGGRLGPLSEPILHTRHIDAKPLRRRDRLRIIETDALDDFSIRGATAVCNFDPIIRTLVRAA